MNKLRLFFGGKTFLAAVGTIVTGVLMIYDQIDIRPLVTYFVGDNEAATGAIVVVIGAIFLVLRFTTSGAMPWLAYSPERQSLGIKNGIIPPPTDSE